MAGNVKWNIESNLKEHADDAIKAAKGIRKLLDEEKKSDAVLKKKLRSEREQEKQRKKLDRLNKTAIRNEKALTRETAMAAKATARDAQAKERSARASATLAAKDAALLDRVRSRQRRLRGGGVSRGGRSGVGGQLKGLATIATVAKGAHLIEQSFSKSADAANELSSSITPLIALGDNAKDIRKISDEVNTMRVVYGATADEVSQLKFNIQSGGAALDKATQNNIRNMSLLSNQVAGFDTDSISKAALKSFNIFGKEIGSVTDVFNKFVITASDADANINEMAQSLPELFAAAKGVGSSMDDTLASVIALTPNAGTASKAIINLRNMFLRLEKAQIAGVLSAKDFRGQLEELKTKDVGTQMKIMEIEGFSAFTALTGAAGIFDSSLEKLSAKTGNLIAEMGKLRDEADPAFKISKQLKSFEEEKKITRGGPGAASVAGELSERTDQFLSGLTGAVLQAASLLSKGASFSPGVLAANVLGAGDVFGEASDSLSGQAETEFVNANLSRMNANQLKSERMQQQTALSLQKSNASTLKKSKEQL